MPHQQQDGQPLLRLVSEVMAPVRFTSPADFDAIRALLNERLLLSGFRVLEDGKVARVKAGRSQAIEAIQAGGISAS
jgi:hypothetical protein